MIFITVGTHEQPFNRLLEYMDKFIAETRLSEEIICQSGYSTYTPKNFATQKFLKQKAVLDNIKKARVIITHGGPSSFIPVLANNKVPIVVPRQKEYDEHVNNHQLDFCRKIEQTNHSIKLANTYSSFKKALLNQQKHISSEPFISNNANFCSKLNDMLNNTTKIGILSMQRIKNYGSFLQAYALKHLIEELGKEVEFVDYQVQPPLMQAQDKSSKLTKLHQALKSQAPLHQRIQYILYKKNFSKKYNKLLRLTKRPNYRPTLQTLVIGSDEVFNCIQSNKNVGYSLELFGKDNRAKKVITYAASFGNTTLDKIKEHHKQDELSSLLNRISSISVRDGNSYQIVTSLINKQPSIHLDPVLIFDYMNKAEIPKLHITEKYMIVYAYSDRISTQEAKNIKSYATKKGLKIYAIGGLQSCANKFISCSPLKVLSYFKHAECIVTDTFHGSIFSIINNKPFAAIVRRSIGNSYGNEEKLIDLLTRLKLEKQIIHNINDLDHILSRDINYNTTNQIIHDERKKAIQYLEENLK